MLTRAPIRSLSGCPAGVVLAITMLVGCGSAQVSPDGGSDDAEAWRSLDGRDDSRATEGGTDVPLDLEMELPAVTNPIGDASGPDEAAAEIGHGSFSEFEIPVPPQGSEPGRITAGPDGNVWFLDISAIRRMTPQGVVATFPLSDTAHDLASGPDGNIWFTSGIIGRVTVDGDVTEFLHVAGGPAHPSGIKAGPDGNMWFTDMPNKIGLITPAGAVTEFDLPTPDSRPGRLAKGADGNMWFTEQWSARVGRITAAGVVTEFATGLVEGPQQSAPFIAMCAGPDGNVWFVDIERNRVGRITTGGVMTDFPVPTPASGLVDVTAGPDGNVWFTESGSNKLGRVTPEGIVTEIEIPNARSTYYPNGITSGADGALWITAVNGTGRPKLPSKIIRFQP